VEQLVIHLRALQHGLEALPVSHSQRSRALPPRRNAKETPLLLHPFGRIDPIFHLSFSGIGQIAARSDHGQATIETCGLDRESLRRVREPIAIDINRHVDRLELALAQNDYRCALDAVTDLLSLGADHRAHAGMVRAIVWERLGHPWSELERLKKRLQGKLRRAPAADGAGRRRPSGQPR